MSAPSEQPRFDGGTAGASARREYARRKANRQNRVREKHPHIGGAVLALGKGPPSSETRWAQGASGEEHVAKILAQRLNDDVYVLHDRRIAGSRANIDHIAVAPSGVWVIDTKRHKGKGRATAKVAVRTPLLGSAKLTVDGRDESQLVEGLAKQFELVVAAMRGIAPDVPVHGALCFVDADLPVLGKLTMNGLYVVSPKRLVKRLSASGPVVATGARVLAGDLSRRFPPA